MEKQYNHQDAESHGRKLWQEKQIYRIEKGAQPLYSIDTPPPTVSGSLHIGHIFSYTQADIIARYRRMQGFAVFYPFGFDDNGLPTERYVEKKRSISAHNFSRSEFIALCLQETKEAEEQFTDLWQHMGLSVDWNACYSTISESSRKLSQESFIDLYNKGFIYRKNEPALFCTTCRTSVAQAELDDAQKPSIFNDIIFKEKENGKDLTIATTRPELLASVVAILYHSDDVRYQNLKDRHAIVPLFHQEVPILADDLVVPEKGSGLVMVSTFGDKTDVYWFKKHKLPYRPTLDVDGKFNEKAGMIAGLYVNQARKLVIEELQKANLLVLQQNIMHTVNIHERCKKEIEYLMLPQWFLKILDYKKELVALADQINWYPQHMKIRYVNWVEHLSWDWCLSRQRFFGIPFPAWYCKDCGQILLPSIEQLPVDPQETSFPGKQCTQCKSSNITPDTDVMDTWNTSSITPYLCYALYAGTTNGVFTTANGSNFIPMSMRPQAHDIIRTWAFYTMTKSWMHNKTIPWSNIVISGHVLSSGKEKLSKSKDNAALTPQTLLEQYPADAVRYWTASGALGTDVAFSEAQIKIGQRLITKLWNAFRFIEEHIKDVAITTAPETLGSCNEWLLDAATATFEKYTKELERNEFSLALDSIEKFFWQTFCDNYLELVKDQLFNPGKYAADEVAATRWTLATMGMRILQWYAPYIPFVTETLYQQLYKNSGKAVSLHSTHFNQWQTEYDFSASVITMNIVLAIITQVRRLKTEKQLSLKTPLHRLTINAPNVLNLMPIKNQEQLLRGVSQAQEIIITQTDDHTMALQGDAEHWSATIYIDYIAS